MTKGVLVDLTKCIGCNSCVVACKMYNKNDWIDDRAPTDGEEAKLADANWTVVQKCRISTTTGKSINKNTPPQPAGSEVWRYVKRQCLHCKEPACVSSCFATAFRRTELGPVVYYPNLCVGCRYCMLACPFSIPKFEWDKPIPVLTKCTMCHDRVENGDPPACVTVCPTHVMKFGEHEELLQEAKAILSRNREYLLQIYDEKEVDAILARDYVQDIYGEKEAGGTLWMYISDKPFESLGFKTNVPKKSIPSTTYKFVHASPWVGGIWLVILACLYFITGRRSKIQSEKAAEMAKTENQT